MSEDDLLNKEKANPGAIIAESKEGVLTRYRNLDGSPRVNQRSGDFRNF